ncbi:MAG: hypothetical protein INH41_19880, partial [Myxococcaceae bacterium]|nr:hypothetical protein [Myxococcaceae bacterium]
MTRRGVVPGLLLLCGCWAPIEATEDGLRRVVREPSDAGRSGPGVDAGAVDGGAVDGGTLPRVAVIAPVGGPLPEACGALRERLEARLPPDGACGSGCLFTVQEDGGALVFRAGLGGERLWLPIEGGLGPENVVFVSQRDGQRWLVGKPLRGERVVRLQALPDGAIE